LRKVDSVVIIARTSLGFEIIGLRFPISLV
jgi:hypothetical protein